MTSRFVVAALAAATLAVVGVGAYLLWDGRSSETVGDTDEHAGHGAASARFPAPPSGAVVFARQDGARVLALGVVPESAGVRVQISVVGPQGNGVPDLDVSFSVRHDEGLESATGEPCGPGCYSARVDVPAPRAVSVSVAGSQETDWDVPMPRDWPPPDAGPIVERADQVWRRLRTLVYTERLASDERNVVTSRWRIVAPNRVSYRITDGSSAVVIGERRWDSADGRRWTETTQSPLRQPVPFWAGFRDAHLLAAVTVRGRPAWRISFFDPRTPAWFEVAVDRQTFRTLELDMFTTAHFMRVVYGPFNAPIEIRPPR